MPTLVTIQEVSPLLSSSIQSVLTQEGVFDTVERQAALCIREWSGITLPASPDERGADLEWVITPMAFAISFLVSGNLAMKSDELETRQRAWWREAQVIARAHRVNTESSLTGTIKDLHT